MALVVNTNIAAISSRNYANSAESDLRTAMERLSSGKRINSAADDAAGLAISERMNAQIKGFNQAIRNVNDGISMTQAVDGALGEITNSLQRMRELAVQAVNGSNTGADRIALQNEFASLNEQINQTATSTRFNGMSLLNGNFAGRSIQSGASVGETIGVGFANASSDALGMYYAETSLSVNDTGANDLSNLFFDNGNTAFEEFGALGSDYTNGVEEMTMAITTRGARQLDLTDADLQSGTQIFVSADEEASSIAAKINASGAGVSAYAETEIQIQLAAAETTNIVNSDDPTAATASITMYLGSGQRSGAYTSFTIGSGALEDQATFAQRLAQEVNATSSVHGITAEVDGNDGITVRLNQAEGRDIKLFSEFTDVGTATLQVAEREVDGNTTAMEANDIQAAGNTDFGIAVAGSVRIYSGQEFQVKDTEANATANFNTTTTDFWRLSGVDLTTTAKSKASIAIIDSALDAVSAQRSQAGALQNRLEIAADGLAVASEKQSQAYGRIVDADFALESSNLARQQILQQVSTAMLAQANAMPQVVLSLIQ